MKIARVGADTRGAALLSVQHWVLILLCERDKVLARSVVFNLKISLFYFNFQMVSLACCHLSTSLPWEVVIQR